jgi:hypothetical protein
MKTIQEAEEVIKQRFSSEGFKGEFQYDPAKVIENERWWYIPCGWIGCGGCIVNKSDGYVNWLGSAIRLEDCFWGHDQGLVCDLVDFSFGPETDRKLAARLLVKFQHMHPNARGTLPKEPVWYRESEIPKAISRQFPIFKRHFVWYAIPELRKSSEHDRLLFTSTLSTRA